MAQQFQSPETYAVGQQVTAARLNNMINNAVPLPGLITDRTAITSNTVATDDKILIYDASASALRSSNVSDIFGSGVAINTSGISYSGQDIQINVSDSTPITTASFVSADGITATVTATAHGFSAGGTNLIEVSGAPSTYNGIFVFTYVDANTFTYTTFSNGTIVTSPTVITVKRKGAIRNSSSIVTNSHLSVTQQSVFGGAIYAKGILNVTGSLNCASTASITGNTTIAGNLSVTGNITKGGTTNYNLYSVASVMMPGLYWDRTTHGSYTYSATWFLTTGRTLYNEVFVVPTNEIWEIQYTATLFYNSDDGYALAWLKNGVIDDNAYAENQVGVSNPISRPGYVPIGHSTVLTAGTNTITIKFGVFGGSGFDAAYLGSSGLPGRYIIRKYKI